MKKLKYCSTCGSSNSFGFKDGANRYYCQRCGDIHYENPKPTATLICPKNEEILLVKRAFSPSKGLWGLPGGFIELNETPEDGAIRELKEETNLNGKVVKFLTEVNTASFSSLFIISSSGRSFDTSLKLFLRISSQDATKLLSSFKLGFFPEK